MIDIADGNASDEPTATPSHAQTSDSSKSPCEVTIGNLTFSGDFDSGNLGRIEKSQDCDSEFVVWPRSDCEGTPQATKSRTWFCFSVQGAVPGQELKFDIRMTPQVKLYEHGMRPVFRALPSQPEWTRVARSTPCNGSRVLDHFSIRLHHTVQTPADEVLFFAFCYPFTYGDLMARLAWLDTLFGDEARLRNRWLHLEQLKMRAAGVDFRAAGLPQELLEADEPHKVDPTALRDAAYLAALEASVEAGPLKAKLLGAAAAHAAEAMLPLELPLDEFGAPLVHYRREVLTRSLEGRRIDVITITGQPQPHPNIPPDLLSGERVDRPQRKRVVLLSARVHPGETPATHVIDGAIHFLLRSNDPRALALRARYIFKIIAILNPDGVCHGHYRADTRGVNLNRMYVAGIVNRDLHPSVAAYMSLVRKLQADGDLALVVDMHAHAGRRGCFFYGTRLDNEADRVESALFAKLVAKNTPWFDYDGCNWFASDGTDGSARSFVTAATQQQGQVLPLVYTLECNYDSGVAVNSLAERSGTHSLPTGRLSPEPTPIKNTMGPKYTPEAWRNIGQAILLAMLDYGEANPHSRLGPPGSGWLKSFRGAVAASLAKREAEKKPPRPPKEGDSEGEDET